MEGEGITEMSYVLLEFHTSTVRRHCATTPVAPTSSTHQCCAPVTVPLCHYAEYYKIEQTGRWTTDTSVWVCRNSMLKCVKL